MAAVVLARFHTLNGLNAGTTLLLLMAALKLLETRRTRDELVLIGAGLFLLLAACLDRQNLARVPLYALQAWLCCAALAAVVTPSLPLRAAAGLAARTLLIAAPLAVALFVFFPRLPGSFWAIPRGNSALTGLSDSIEPGQHRASGGRLQRGVPGEVRRSAPGRGAAVLARSGAARVRRAHLAACRGQLPLTAAPAIPG